MSFPGCIPTIRGCRLAVAVAAPREGGRSDRGARESCGEEGAAGLRWLEHTSRAGGKGGGMQSCRVTEGRRCVPRHPAILAYTSKGHTYSMTGPSCRSPSCPAPPSQLSRQLCALQPPPAAAGGCRVRGGGHLAARGAPPMKGTRSGQGRHTGEAAEKGLSAPPCPHLPCKVQRTPWTNPLISLQVSLITLQTRDWGKLDLRVLKAEGWAGGLQGGVRWGCRAVRVLQGVWWQQRF